MPKRFWPAAVLASVLLFTGCAVTPTPFDRTSLPGDGGASGLVGPTWVLDELNDEPAVEDASTTLTFNEDGTLGGSGGCNGYGGNYTLDGDQLGISGLISTMMACPGPIMPQENAFMDALPRTTKFAIVDDQLTLYEQDRALAIFTAQPQELAGTSWQVTSYYDGQDAIVSVLAGTDPTVSFGDDGTMTGTTGCNSISGTYQVAPEGTLKLGELAKTEMGCLDPEGIMQQDEALPTALTSAVNYHIEGTRLTLTSGDGTTAVQLVQA
ncbi:META domain-containing protein [Propionimicrobium sp. PCR01-08-3]|uniref:META domain-containing protein n=1 Tax=Propionimicrobium sp. PCR01-08-3 TaxID=3052086 RepID=UPI00255CF0EA|nr:META domain-containing protein [Propionimicrobium sp. PCR01-08-3]WIY82783.1 META domain-containing protein [Propionimicrobium sp. PCR01-08-3]